VSTRRVFEENWHWQRLSSIMLAKQKQGGAASLKSGSGGALPQPDGWQEKGRRRMHFGAGAQTRARSNKAQARPSSSAAAVSTARAVGNLASSSAGGVPAGHWAETSDSAARESDVASGRPSRLCRTGFAVSSSSQPSIDFEIYRLKKMSGALPLASRIICKAVY
jgi:hypothetical protein